MTSVAHSVAKSVGFHIGAHVNPLPPAENTAPTDITLSVASIDEGNEIGDVIGAFSATDANVGDTFTYTLVAGIGDTDNASFTIDVANLKAGEVFDYETKASYSIRVRSTDAGGLYTEKVFIITITDIVSVTLTNLMTNGSFEAWSTTKPTTMQENPSETTFLCEQSTDSKAGTYSLKVINKTATGELTSFRFNNFTQTAGKKIYVGMWVKTSKSLDRILYKTGSNYPEFMLPPYKLDNWEWCSYIGITPAAGNWFYHRFIMPNRQVDDYFMIDGLTVLNLTTSFGAGNEPSLRDIDLVVKSVPYISTTQLIEDYNSTITNLRADDPLQAARQLRLTNGIIRVGTANTPTDRLYPIQMHKFIRDLDVDLYASNQTAETTDTSISFANRTINENLLYTHYWGRTVQAYGWDGLAMASAFPMLNVVDGPVPSQGYIKSTVNILGQSVSFYSIHLPAFGTNLQGKGYITGLYNNLIVLDTSDYIIVAGDFNYPHVDQDATVWETFTNNGFLSAMGEPHGWLITHPTLPGYIDYMLVKGFNILNTKVFPLSLLGDHEGAFVSELQLVLPE